MRIVLVTPPAVPAVALDLAKLHLRVDGILEDAYITGLIDAATKFCEARSHLCFVNRTYDVFLDGWGGYWGQRQSYLFWGGAIGTTIYNNAFTADSIRLPHGPVSSVTSVKYVDLSGTQQTWSSSNYVASLGNPARVTGKQGQYYPPLADQPDVVTIRYVAGYGPDATTVPGAAVSAILLVLERLYRQRSAISEESFSEVPITVDALLDSLGCGSNLFA